MSAKKQKRARQHHVLPQFYLRRWAGADGAVAMLTRDGREVVSGTPSLGVEKDFYAMRRPDGAKDSSVETGLLQRWDGLGSAALARMLDDGGFPPSDEDRGTLGLWLGLQWLRGRRSRQTAAETYDLVTKLLVTQGLDIPSPGPEQELGGAKPAGADGDSVAVPALGGLTDELKAVLRDTDSYTFPMDQEHHIAQMVKGVPDVAECFLVADWLLMRFGTPCLLTSDEPIALLREPSPQNEMLGLGPENADMAFVPVAPDACLVICRGSQTGVDMTVTGGPRDAANINLMTLSSPWRQLYRHPSAAPFPTDVPPLPDAFVTVS